MRPRISIRVSVRPSVGPWVRPSCVFFKSRKSRGNDIESLEKKIWQIWQINLTNLTNLSDKAILVPNFRRIFDRTNLFKISWGVIKIKSPKFGPALSLSQMISINVHFVSQCKFVSIFFIFLIHHHNINNHEHYWTLLGIFKFPILKWIMPKNHEY